MKKILILFLLIPLLFAFCGNANDKDANMFSFKGNTQGTYYQVTYYAKDSIVTHSEIKQLLDDFLKIASLWEPNSEISRVNRNENIKISKNFYNIFINAQEISRLTNGAFDITVGDLVNAWGFGPEQREDSVLRKIDDLRKYTGYQNVDIIDEKVIKKFPETKLDFNAIAKGYSVDLLANHLRLRKVENFIVDVGGEVYASGLKPNNGKWNVGIEKPAANNHSNRELQSVIAISDKAVATSGTYRNYFVKDSIRYSHTIDPTTGRPVSHTLLSATVIAENCVTADALATAFMVMGREKAMEFLSKNPQYEGYFIYCDENNELQTVCTEGFKKYLL